MKTNKTLMLIAITIYMMVIVLQCGTINNGGDKQAPLVLLTNPTEGDTVWGTVVIKAQATDNEGVKEVRFYANADLIGLDETTPYTFNWITSPYANSSVQLKAIAYDIEGNTGTSGIVTIYVKDSTGTTSGKPVADFSYATDDLKLILNASLSQCPGCVILSYNWDFGDGNYGTGISTTHVYGVAGAYLVQLIVIADNGKTDTAAQVVEMQILGVKPIAKITANVTSGEAPLTINFDGSLSTDVDGTITRYVWDFGDGAGAMGANSSHTYLIAGMYKVTLMVIDDMELFDTDSIMISVTEAERHAPIAILDASPLTGPAPLTVSFDASRSVDIDENISAYTWNFGDGGTSAAATINHIYTSQGTYGVRLIVTDTDGLADTSEVTIVVTEPLNAPPVANISASPLNGEAPLSVTFNGSASTDTPPGSIVGYAWDFGDGEIGSGVNVTHIYTNAGNYIVTLTVTDDRGATGTNDVEIVVTEHENQSPRAVIKLSAAMAYVMDTITFDGTGSSDPEGGALTYQWTINRAVAGTTPIIKYYFTTPGSYGISLRVRDPQGATGTNDTVLAILGLPDLQIDSIKVYNLDFNEKSYYALLKNIGSAAVSNVPITYTKESYQNGRYTQDVSKTVMYSPTLNPGTSAWVYFYTLGYHFTGQVLDFKLTAEANKLRTIDEIGYTNNIYSRAEDMPVANLKITSSDITRREITSSIPGYKRYEYTLKVNNTGDYQSIATTVDAIIFGWNALSGDTQRDTVFNLSAINAGSYGTVKFSAYSSAKGYVKGVEYDVNPDDNFLESTTTDNKAKLMF